MPIHNAEFIRIAAVKTHAICNVGSGRKTAAAPNKSAAASTAPARGLIRAAASRNGKTVPVVNANRQLPNDKVLADGLDGRA